MALEGTEHSVQETQLPLDGVRVVDHTYGNGMETTARILADLGADTIRVEPPQGTRTRRVQQFLSSADLYDAVHNANKRSVSLDLDTVDGREDFERLVSTADIFITSSLDDEMPEDLGAQRLADRYPTLVVVSLTDYGRTGPYRNWTATEATHMALGGVLSRSGLSGADPILPPGNIATESAAAQAAWSALAAYYHRLVRGHGDLVDCSLYEGVVQGLDPGFGIGGTAGGGVPGVSGPRGRPDAAHLYPVFPCADGWVRICVLSQRQWQGMLRWLGEPEELMDPRLSSLTVRFAEAHRILPVIGRRFASLTRAEIMADGDAYGVPAAGLADVREVLDNEHFAARGAFVDVTLRDGTTTSVCNGLVEVDGRRAGIRTPAPGEGAHTRDVLDSLTVPDQSIDQPPSEFAPSRPFGELRVLDLGVIVVGAETSRLFADLGADVIKIENRSFPDGSRQSVDEYSISPSFAYGHRSKRSLGLNLRSDEGRTLFLDLVRQADVVMSNFKPGTLDSLGLGSDQLMATNPRIVLAESSAFGSHGPWSHKMGYGPLVRAAVGLAGLWRYPGNDAQSLRSFSDTSTVYPDHVAARIGAIAVLAKLIDRRRSGRGGMVAVAQAEVIASQLSMQIALESVAPGALTVGQTRGPILEGVYPCAGDDEWCVVCVRDDQDWSRLATVLGLPASDARFACQEDRLRNRAALDVLVSQWTSGRAPRESMEILQASGIPAAMMQRISDMTTDPHLRARHFLRTLRHPLIDAELPCEGGPAIFGRIADPELAPAPRQGEQTVDVLSGVLGLTPSNIADLVASGAVELAASREARTEAPA